MKQLRKYFPIHPGASCKLVAGVDPAGPEPVIVWFCTTHNWQMTDWQTLCWDGGDSGMDITCVKVRARVEVLDE